MAHIAPAAEEPRTRRNSDTASLYSIGSEYSWKGMIQPPTRYYDNPIATFMQDDALNRFASVNLDDSSSSDDGEPSERLSEMPLRQWPRHVSSPVPDLDSSSSSITTRSGSDISYIAHPHQMYGLQDHDGVLYTRRHIGPVAVNRSTPKIGSYPCLFEFDACPSLCTSGEWVSHVESHLGGIEPPKSCRCTICGESFETDTPAITWNRFLCHVIGHEYGGFIYPDTDFLEYCTSKDIISECTRNRSDQRPSNPRRGNPQRRSQETLIYKRTPKRFIDSGDSVATVDYPSDWSVKPERQDPEYIYVRAGQGRIKVARS